MDGIVILRSAYPMGRSSSGRTFKTFSTAVEWVTRTRLKIEYIIHLVDDFLLIAPTELHCKNQLALFLDLSYLGIPIASEKICGAATTYRLLA